MTEEGEIGRGSVWPWLIAGVGCIALVVLIAVGPATVPRSDLGGEYYLIGPGMAVFSLGAALSFRQVARIAKNPVGGRLATGVSILAYAMLFIAVVATCNQ